MKKQMKKQLQFLGFSEKHIKRVWKLKKWVKALEKAGYAKNDIANILIEEVYRLR